MGTSNFARGNSSRLFAVEIQEEWDYDDLKDNLKYAFKAAKEKGMFDTEYYSNAFNEKNNNRNFEGNVILMVTSKSKHYKTIGEFYIEVGIIIRNGYYSGVNLDWECEIVSDSERYDHDEEIVIDDYNYDVSTKQAKQFSEYVNNWKEKEMTKIINDVEQILSEYSTELNVVATFSNGETIYEKA